MDFAALELELSTFLQGKINNPKVVSTPLPETEAEFKKVFGKEVVIVALSDEEPEPIVKSISAVYQETEITFAFLIQSRSLRGAADKLGVYTLHRLIKQYMTGYPPSDGKPFTYAGFKMQEKVEDVFHYAVYFKTKGCNIQATNTFDLDGPLLKEVHYR